MTFVVIFLVNAALSFALSLVVAHLVGPDSFGRYAVALSVSVAVNTALFEWLRLSTTRFYSQRSLRVTVGATLDLCYGATSAAILAAGAVLLLSGADLGLSPGLLAAALVVGLSVGLFDYRTAQARARFLDRRYAALLLTRGCLAFALAAGAAWIWREPVYALAGSALASVLTLVTVRDTQRPGGRGSFDRALLSRFARYAVPLVAAGAIYQLLPLINRSVLAGRVGFAEAGYLSLAGEIAVRLFQNLGSALDLSLFQLAVRAEERDGPEAGARQTARNLAVVVAIILPASVGLATIWPSFEAVFVPASFQGRIATVMMLSIPAFAAYALVQYGLNPFFQIRHRTGPAVGAAAVALLVDALLLLAWPFDHEDVAGVAAIQFAAFGAGLAVTMLAALASGVRLPWRNLGAAAAASAVMGAALWPWRDSLPPAIGLPAQVLAGAVTYGVAAYALDVAGTRDLFRMLARRRSRASIR